MSVPCSNERASPKSATCIEVVSSKTHVSSKYSGK